MIGRPRHDAQGPALFRRLAADRPYTGSFHEAENAGRPGLKFSGLRLDGTSLPRIIHVVLICDTPWRELAFSPEDFLQI